MSLPSRLWRHTHICYTNSNVNHTMCLLLRLLRLLASASLYQLCRTLGLICLVTLTVSMDGLATWDLPQQWQKPVSSPCRCATHPWGNTNASSPQELQVLVRHMLTHLLSHSLTHAHPPHSHMHTPMHTPTDTPTHTSTYLPTHRPAPPTLLTSCSPCMALCTGIKCSANQLLYRMWALCLQ